MVKVHPKFMRRDSLFQETSLLCRALKEGYVGIAIQLLQDHGLLVVVIPFQSFSCCYPIPILQLLLPHSNPSVVVIPFQSFSCC